MQWDKSNLEARCVTCHELKYKSEILLTYCKHSTICWATGKENEQQTTGPRFERNVNWKKSPNFSDWVDRPSLKCMCVYY